MWWLGLLIAVLVLWLTLELTQIRKLIGAFAARLDHYEDWRKSEIYWLEKTIETQKYLQDAGVQNQKYILQLEDRLRELQGNNSEEMWDWYDNDTAAEPTGTMEEQSDEQSPVSLRAGERVEKIAYGRNIPPGAQGTVEYVVGKFVGVRFDTGESVAIRAGDLKTISTPKQEP